LGLKVTVALGFNVFVGLGSTVFITDKASSLAVLVITCSVCAGFDVIPGVSEGLSVGGWLSSCGGDIESVRLDFSAVSGSWPTVEVGAGFREHAENAIIQIMANITEVLFCIFSNSWNFAVEK